MGRRSPMASSSTTPHVSCARVPSDEGVHARHRVPRERIERTVEAHGQPARLLAQPGHVRGVALDAREVQLDRHAALTEEPYGLDQEVRALQEVQRGPSTRGRAVAPGPAAAADPRPRAASRGRRNHPNRRDRAEEALERSRLVVAQREPRPRAHSSSRRTSGAPALEHRGLIGAREPRVSAYEHARRRQSRHGSGASGASQKCARGPARTLKVDQSTWSREICAERDDARQLAPRRRAHDEGRSSGAPSGARARRGRAAPCRAAPTKARPTWGERGSSSSGRLVSGPSGGGMLVTRGNERPLSGFAVHPSGSTAAGSACPVRAGDHERARGRAREGRAPEPLHRALRAAVELGRIARGRPGAYAQGAGHAAILARPTRVLRSRERVPSSGLAPDATLPAR
jgi:hypothetical protein